MAQSTTIDDLPKYSDAELAHFGISVNVDENGVKEYTFGNGRVSIKDNRRKPPKQGILNPNTMKPFWNEPFLTIIRRDLDRLPLK